MGGRSGDRGNHQDETKFLNWFALVWLSLLSSIKVRASALSRRSMLAALEGVTIGRENRPSGCHYCARIYILAAAFATPAAVAEASTCKWVKIGYDKSHYDNTGAWCPRGSFLTRLDLDGGRDGANFPIVGKAQCCTATAAASTLSGDIDPGKADGASVGEVDVLQAQINRLREELEALKQRVNALPQ